MNPTNEDEERRIWCNFSLFRVFTCCFMTVVISSFTVYGEGNISCFFFSFLHTDDGWLFIQREIYFSIRQMSVIFLYQTFCWSVYGWKINMLTNNLSAVWVSLLCVAEDQPGNEVNLNDECKWWSCELRSNMTEMDRPSSVMSRGCNVTMKTYFKLRF